MSLNFTLSINKIVEQHIKNKTHKFNVLRFWVEGGVISLCGFWFRRFQASMSRKCVNNSTSEKFVKCV